MPSADQVPVKRAFDNALALVGCPDRRIDPALHYVLFDDSPVPHKNQIKALALISESVSSGSLLPVLMISLMISCFRQDDHSDCHFHQDDSLQNAPLTFYCLQNYRMKP